MLLKTMFIVLYIFLYIFLLHLFKTSQDLAITDPLRKNIFHNQISSNHFSGYQLKSLSMFRGGGHVSLDQLV